MKQLNRWDLAPYRRIITAWYQTDTLFVTFADGSKVQVPVCDVVPPGFDNISWHEVAATPYHIVVPTPDAEDGELEIPFDVIRRATDPEYAEHWRIAAFNSYRRDGRRLQKLRREHKLTRDELAARIGLSAADLKRIEEGDPDLVSAHTTKLMEAMGLPRDALFARRRRTSTRKTVA